ncbi:hypothetical protein IscW_ISCW006408 [Ixodes scapularis]|uniref:Uncharacterized protein n=1 Tax=Ixodes scapularis TaxID=6945 RepID=B7PMJ6_IXOSC|nr:hypothetical protein IscW_ISCW006408 [Ixodes scapularis]|eukprot:XP_002434994.1 hypothetical protein IscW_ISCW006408 [Ixodes scapularis]
MCQSTLQLGVRKAKSRAAVQGTLGQRLALLWHLFFDVLFPPSSKPDLPEPTRLAHTYEANQRIPLRVFQLLTVAMHTFESLLCHSHRMYRDLQETSDAKRKNTSFTNCQGGTQKQGSLACEICCFSGQLDI